MLLTAEQVCHLSNKKIKKKKRTKHLWTCVFRCHYTYSFQSSNPNSSALGRSTSSSFHCRRHSFLLPSSKTSLPPLVENGLSKPHWFPSPQASSVVPTETRFFEAVRLHFRQPDLDSGLHTVTFKPLFVFSKKNQVFIYLNLWSVWLFLHYLLNANICFVVLLDRVFLVVYFISRVWFRWLGTTVFIHFINDALDFDLWCIWHIKSISSRYLLEPKYFFYLIYFQFDWIFSI